MVLRSPGGVSGAPYCNRTATGRSCPLAPLLILTSLWVVPSADRKGWLRCIDANERRYEDKLRSLSFPRSGQDPCSMGSHAPEGFSPHSGRGSGHIWLY